jgi:hypothetical protein
MRKTITLSPLILTVKPVSMPNNFHPKQLWCNRNVINICLCTDTYAAASPLELNTDCEAIAVTILALMKADLKSPSEVHTEPSLGAILGTRSEL